jgi:hydrogenase-4 component F
MAALLIVIFVGFMNHFRVMYYASAGNPPIVSRQSAWCVAPMWAALIALLVLGLWWPSGVWNYLSAIAHSGVGAPR